MADLPPAQGANGPVTFTELFQQFPDAYNGMYHGFLNEYHDENKTPDQLLRLSTTNFPTDRVPSVFIFQDNQRKIRSVHHMHLITPLIGQPAGEWNDVCIGFVSDMHNGHITTLRLPNNMFTMSPPALVPTTATMQAQLAANHNDMIPPLDPGDDIEEIMSRRMIPVPHAYIQHFLFRTLTPPEAWNQVGLQIIADGRENDCQILLNFLRMTAVNTRGQLRNDPVLLPQIATIIDVHPPVGDANFYAHLTYKLRSLLPAGVMAPTPNAIIQQVVHGQNMIRQTLQEAAIETRAARLQEHETATAPKTFSEAFPANASKIRALCNAGNDDDMLPEFWKQLARVNGKKTIGFNLFQELVTARALEPDSAHVQPIVSAALYEQVSKFRIGSNDQEDLKSGVSPFLMCPIGYHRADAQRQLNDQYVMVNDGNAPTLADTRQILPATYNIPTNIYVLVDFIGSYSVIIDVLLGVDHPLATRLRQHHQYWDMHKSTVVNALMPEAHGIAVLHTLRYLQIECLSYFSAKMYSLPASAPDFQFLERTIRNRTFGSLPPMPAEYYYSQAAQQQKTPPPSGAASSATAPTAAPTSNTRTRGERTAGAQVTAPTDATVPTWLERFSADKKSIQTLKLDGAGKLPKIRDGSSTICLSYHLRGQCFDNCGSKSTHRKLTAEEHATFQQFVDKHL